jgi:hypothetical protein
MWAQERIFGRVGERRFWSPVCSALLAAIVLDSDAVLAADGDATVQPALSADALIDADSRIGSDVLSPIRAQAPAPISMPVPMPTTAVGASLVSGDASRAPIRLDARSVLGLREMFTFSGSWELPNERAMRTLELVDAHPTALPPADDYRINSDPLRTPQATWFDQHVELTFKDGIAFKENFQWRGMNLRLKIGGPMLKGDPGLGVRLRGLQLSGHAVEVRARATTDMQDLRIQIAF